MSFLFEEDYQQDLELLEQGLLERLRNPQAMIRFGYGWKGGGGQRTPKLLSKKPGSHEIHHLRGKRDGPPRVIRGGTSRVRTDIVASGAGYRQPKKRERAVTRSYLSNRIVRDPDIFFN